jgi:YD repeat-containing protein
MAKRSLVLFFILLLAFAFVGFSSVQAHSSKYPVTAVIDEVVEWYHSELGREKIYARQFMVEIANQESHMGTYNVGGSTYPGNAGGVGFAQFTTIAMTDVQNRLLNHPQRLNAIREKFGFDPLAVNREDFGSIENDIISAVFMREFLLSNPRPTPKTLKARAELWKDWYNANPDLDRRETINQYIQINSYSDPEGSLWVYSGTNTEGTDVYSSPFNPKVLAMKNSDGFFCVVDSPSSEPELSCLNGELFYDNAGCVSKLLSGDDVMTYKYWNPDCSIRSFLTSQGNFLYSRSGNLLSEVYSGLSDLNTHYTYSLDGSLESISKNNAIVKFVYNQQEIVESIITSYASNGRSFRTRTDYYYDGDGRVTEIVSPGKETSFTYGPQGELEREDFLIYRDGETINEWISYQYDPQGNLISMSDNTGEEVFYSYENLEYACEELACIDFNCPEPDECFTFYNDNNEPYLCADYTFQESVCSYYELTSQTIGNQILTFNTDIDLDSEEVCMYYPYLDENEDCHTPFFAYDQEGFLLETEDYLSQYDDYRISLIQDKALLDVGVSSAIHFDQYYSDGLLKSMLSDGGLRESYAYNPFGEMIYVSLESQELDGGSGFTGAAIKNIFFSTLNMITGRAIQSSNHNSQTFYFASPGDYDVLYSFSEFQEVLGEYERVHGEIPEIDFTNEKKCSIFEGYVIFDEEVYLDSCKDDSTKIEYYCGFSLLSWKNIVKSRDVSCSGGCYGGVCYELEEFEPECDNDTECDVGEVCLEGFCVEEPEPIIPECVNDPECDQGMICVENQCVWDLPDDPGRLDGL